MSVYMDHLDNSYSGRPVVFGPFGLDEAKNVVVKMTELMTPRAQRNMAVQTEMYKNGCDLPEDVVKLHQTVDEVYNEMHF